MGSARRILVAFLCGIPSEDLLHDFRGEPQGSEAELLFSLRGLGVLLADADERELLDSLGQFEGTFQLLLGCHGAVAFDEEGVHLGVGVGGQRFHLKPR